MKNLLDLYTDEPILTRLFQLYPDETKNKEGYEKALKELRSLKPKKTDMQISLFRVEEDGEKWVDISGFDPKEPDTHWAIEYRPWREWLGMGFVNDTIEDFDPLDVLAHCLWEMTWSGYSQRSIRARWNSIVGRMKEVEKQIKEDDKS